MEALIIALIDLALSLSLLVAYLRWVERHCLYLILWVESLSSTLSLLFQFPQLSLMDCLFDSLSQYFLLFLSSSYIFHSDLISQFLTIDKIVTSHALLSFSHSEASAFSLRRFTFLSLRLSLLPAIWRYWPFPEAHVFSLLIEASIWRCPSSLMLRLVNGLKLGMLLLLVWKLLIN